MRITGGELRGRMLKVPRAGMRPTQDRVRGSLFAILGDRVPGARVLDLYAGTGAVGIEAWSRGAARVCWVEFHGPMLRCLQENVRTLCGESGTIIRGEVLPTLRRGIPGGPFDIIFADPPYAAGGGDAHAGEWPQVLDRVAAGGLLAPGGWLIMEQGDGEPVVQHAGWRLVKDRRYGGTRLRVYEQGSDGPVEES